MKKYIQIVMLVISVELMSITARAQAWEWATKAGGIENDYANSIYVDHLGNSYIAGTFYDSISFGTVTLVNPGTWSVFTAKYDMSGNIVWAKVAACDSIIHVIGICVDEEGNISITGQYFSTASFGNSGTINLTSAGDYDVFVAHYDNTGDIIWAKSLGGTGIDYAGGIDADSHGDLFLTGDFHISPFPYSGSKVFLAKYDSSGNNSWLRTETNNGNGHFGNGIKTDSAGNCYITGEFFNTIVFDSTTIIDAGNAESNSFIAKFDSYGNVVWGQKAGAASGYCGSKAIDIDYNGNSFITGYYHGTISLGSLSITSQSAPAYDVFIAKCDNEGNFVWVNKSAGSGNAKSISIDNAGNTYISGAFLDTITFGSNVLISSGNADIFIAKEDAGGNFVWATAYGGLQDDNIESIKANADGILLTGEFRSTIHFGSSLSLLDNSSTKTDIYFAKINALTGIEEEENYSSGNGCFPNPAKSEIHFKALAGNEKYILYDASGKVLLQGVLNETNKISIDNLESGIYFILLLSDNDTQKAKRIKFIKG